jgi:hypothetical protein
MVCNCLDSTMDLFFTALLGLLVASTALLIWLCARLRPTRKDRP